VPVLVWAGVLGRIRPLTSLPEVGTEERSCGAMRRAVKGEGGGRGRLPIVALGPGPRNLAGPRSLGLVLVRSSWAARATN
jgi:hypothetical protein